VGSDSQLLQAARCIQRIWRGKVHRTAVVRRFAHKLKQEAQAGTHSQALGKHRIFYWLVGFAFFTLNFATQSMFVTIYSLHANTPSEIALYTLYLRVIQKVFRILCCSAMRAAEQFRMSRNASWDRRNLHLMTVYYMHCYSDIYKQVLFTNIKTWAEFASFYLMDLAITVVSTSILMTSAFIAWDKKEPCWRRHARKGTRCGCSLACSRLVVKRSILDHRGFICFDVFLRNRSSQFAKLQYLVGILYLRATQLSFYGYSLPDNSDLFPGYSPKNPEFDLWMQTQFTACGLLADFAKYTIICVMFDRIWKISPMYVGACHEIENKNFRLATGCAQSFITYPLIH
jgi:hypothetical protein